MSLKTVSVVQSDTISLQCSLCVVQVLNEMDVFWLEGGQSKALSWVSQMTHYTGDLSLLAALDYNEAQHRVLPFISLSLTLKFC